MFQLIGTETRTENTPSQLTRTGTENWPGQVAGTETGIEIT